MAYPVRSLHNRSITAVVNRPRSTSIIHNTESAYFETSNIIPL